MRSFDRSIEFAERSMELAKMYQRAEKVLQEETIRPEDFHRYDQAAIEEDNVYVRHMKEKFERDAAPDEREAKQMADVLEAIVLQFGEQGYWFGGGEEEDVTTLKTAEYDDIKNGADIIVESYRKDGGVSNLGLAVDVTYREDLVSKMARIRNEVRSGDLTTIRYFYSPRRKIRGEQKSVPRVITGISGEHARELGRLWMAQKNKQLSEHPVQIVFLEEMEAQLAAFLAIAEREKHEHAAHALGDALAMVRKALNEKMEFMEQHHDAIKNYKLSDPVYASLMENIRSMKG